MKKVSTLLFTGLLSAVGLLFVSNIQAQTVTVGTGTSVTGTYSTAETPFGTYYHDDRTFLMYTAAEIIAAGGYAGDITSVAFNVASAASQTMNGFNVKIGTTTATGLSGVPTGMTTVYSGTHTATTGWNEFTFSSPYNWNGTDNIIVEVCFDNTYYTSNSTVYYTYQSTNSYVHSRYCDSWCGPGCSLVPYTYQYYYPRANIQFGILPPVANDAGVQAILSPSLPTCDLDSVDIQVVINNFGSDTLYTCDVNWQINTGSATTYSYSGVVAPLGGNDTITIATYTFTNADDLTIWTEDPNGIQDSLASNDTLGMTVSTGLVGTYEIPNDYATFQDAADALLEFGVCGHVIMEVDPGTYSEQVSFGTILGVSDSATVTFTSSTGDPDDVSLQYAASGTSDNYVVKMDGGDYIAFTDMTVRSTATYIYSRVFDLGTGSNNITIDGCLVQSGTYGYTGDYMSCVYMSGSCDNLTLTNNRFERGGYTLRLYGSSGTPSQNMVVNNNEIINGWYYSAQVYYVDGFEFNNNIITADSTQYNYGPRGLYCYTVNEFNITGNYIGADTMNGQYGSGGGYAYAMYLSNCVGSSNPRSKIANNCINSGATGSTGYGYYALYMYNSGLVDVHHNSVNRLGGSSSNYYAFYANNGGSVSVRNNSFNNFHTGYAMYSYGQWTISESDNNNFHNTSGSLVYYGTSQYSTLEDYVNASGYDENSVSVNPMYVDTMLCVTCNDTLDGGGAAVGQMYDIDSVARSTNTPDIGAVEYINANNFTMGNDTTICGDMYTVEAGPAQSVTWSVNGNSSSAFTYDLITTGTAPELFAVSVSMTTEFCGTGTDQVAITLVPDVALDSNTHICADETATLDAGGGANATYSWSTAETTSSIMTTEPGTYSVTKMDEGCESSATTIVTKSTAVDILDLEACAADAPITVDATIPDGTSYAWSGGNSTSTASNTFDDGGDFTVTATDAFGCESVDSFNLVLLDEPTADFTYTGSGGTALHFNSSSSSEVGANTTYMWTFVNGDTSSQANPVYVFPWSGAPATYTVTLEIDNGCGTSIETKQITLDPLSVENLSKGEFAVFPNPASDVVTIATNDVEAGMIQIMDMSGRVVAQSAITAGDNNHTIDVSGIAAGAYTVKVANTVKALIIE